jgi:hypothetical protein
MISGFNCDVSSNCGLLGYYAAIVVIYYRRFGTTYRAWVNYPWIFDPFQKLGAEVQVKVTP